MPTREFSRMVSRSSSVSRSFSSSFALADVREKSQYGLLAVPGNHGHADAYPADLAVGQQQAQFIAAGHVLTGQAPALPVQHQRVVVGVDAVQEADLQHLAQRDAGDLAARALA
jgi:hypothetical protein